jgi:hypothetical protein
MAQKVPFSCLIVERNVFKLLELRHVVHVAGLQENGGLFLSAFPMFVPSLSCKMFVLMYKWLKQTVFTYQVDVDQPELVNRHRVDRVVAVRKRMSLFFESFSLCLSRACLGKMNCFSIKWHGRRDALS